MKNLHARLLLLVVLLMAASIRVVTTRPTSLGLDIQGGMRVVLRAKTEELKGKQWSPENLDTVADIMRNRVDALGVAEPVIYTKPPDQVVLELPGLKDKQKALETIQTTAKLEFRQVPELDNGTWTTEEETGPNGRPTGYEVILSGGKPVSADELEAKVFSKDPILTGAELKPNASAELLPQGTVVNFEFQDGEPKRIFEMFTRANINKRLAVFLDKKLISAPTIEDVIPGKGIIRGNFTAEQAKTLAGLLNAGALPVPLEQLQLTNVEATLGKQAVQQTLLAGIVGLGLVLLFMLFYYKLPGLLADCALILYTLFTFAVFKLIPVTLTVPGIAGFILSIGMAVDANILIFERFKEERLSGKSLRAAIEAGFKRAFTAIFDSNMCTIITCAILYHFGTGAVRGFAVTLAIGVALSMFTAITVSRTFLLSIAGTNFGQNDALYGLGRGLRPNLGVTRRMGLWFGISALTIVPGLIFWGLGGIKKSIEFTGGNEITTQFSRPVTAGQIRSTLAGAGQEEARIVMAEGNLAYITTQAFKSDEEQNRVVTALQNLGGSIQESEKVTPTISRELTRNALLSILCASVLIILYLALRFSIPNFVEGLKFGLCAIGAMLHDAAVVWGAFAIFGYFLNWQIDSLFVTAMLTVIGFSVHDTIVIFDRIRENLRHKARTDTFADVADRSIDQTLVRSINTSLSTLLPLLAMLAFGGPVIRLLVMALTIGIISGTYSSIFNAAPLLVLWKRLSGDRSMAPATGGGPAPRPAARRPEPVAKSRPIQPATAPATPAPPQQAVAKTDDAEEAEAAAAGSTGRVKPKRRKRRM